MKKIVGLMEILISMNGLIGSDFNVAETPTLCLKVEELDKITPSFEINQHKMITENEAELWEEWNKFTAGLKPEFQQSFLRGIKEDLNKKDDQDLVMIVTRLSPYEPPKRSMKFKSDDYILQGKTDDLDKDMLLEKLSFQVRFKSEVSSLCQREEVTFDNVKNQYSISIIHSSLNPQSYDLNLGNAIAGEEFFQSCIGYEKRGYITSNNEVMHKNEAELWEEWNKFTAGLNPELQENFLSGIREDLNEKNDQGLVMTVTRFSTNEAPEKSIKFKLDHHKLQWETDDLDKDVLNERSFLNEISFQVRFESEASNFYQKEIVTFNNITNDYSISVIKGSLNTQSYDLNLGDAIAGEEFFQSCIGYEKKEYIDSNNKLVNINRNERKKWNELVVGLKPEHQDSLFRILKEKMSYKGYGDLQVTIKRVLDMQLTPDSPIMNMNHIDEEMSATPLSSGQIKYETHVTGTWREEGRWIKRHHKFEETGEIIFDNDTGGCSTYSRARNDRPQIIYRGPDEVHVELEPQRPSLCSRFCNACSNLIQRIGECLSPQRSANSARGEPSYENLP